MNRETHQIRLTNDSDTSMVFQLEPECFQFTVAPNENVVITYDYDQEPLELRLGKTSDPVFGAVVPGDGDVIIEKEGQNVFDT